MEEDKEGKEIKDQKDQKDTEEIEKAIVCFDSTGTGHVVAASGIAIESLVFDLGDNYSDNCGLTHCLHDKSPDEPDHGIWVWEGVPEYRERDDGSSDGYEFSDDCWRKLTDEEWSKIRELNDFEIWPRKYLPTTECFKKLSDH